MDARNAALLPKGGKPGGPPPPGGYSAKPRQRYSYRPAALEAHDRRGSDDADAGAAEAAATASIVGTKVGVPPGAAPSAFRFGGSMQAFASAPKNLKEASEEAKEAEAAASGRGDGSNADDEGGEGVDEEVEWDGKGNPPPSWSQQGGQRAGGGGHLPGGASSGRSAIRELLEKRKAEIAAAEAAQAKAAMERRASLDKAQACFDASLLGLASLLSPRLSCLPGSLCWESCKRHSLRASP